MAELQFSLSTVLDYTMPIPTFSQCQSFFVPSCLIPVSCTSGNMYCCQHVRLSACLRVGLTFCSSILLLFCQPFVLSAVLLSACPSVSLCFHQPFILQPSSHVCISSFHPVLLSASSSNQPVLLLACSFPSVPRRLFMTALQ